MPNCIAINGLEHLPNEQTLLIHYNILCTGTWYLSQLLTAYRNVCDTEWTVMYPNFQHPRHTDFPIAVPSPGQGATFAWNYGGIQGISAENFDAYHSYLVQLTIFNYDCYNTGNNPNTGQGSGEPPITGGGSGDPPITGGGGGGGGGGGNGGGGGTRPGYPGDGGPIPIGGIIPGGGGGGLGEIPVLVRLPPGGGGGGGGWVPLPLPGDRPGIPGGGDPRPGWMPMPLPGEPLPPGGGGNGGIIPGIIPIDPPTPGGGIIPGGIPLLPKFPVETNPGGGTTTTIPGIHWKPNENPGRSPGINSLPPGGPNGTINIPPQNPYDPLPGAVVYAESGEDPYKEPSIPIEPGILVGGNLPNIINTNTIGIVSVESSTPIIQNNPTTTNYFSVERPSQNPPGSTQNPFLQFNSLAVNPAINSEVSTFPGGINPTLTPEINSVNTSVEGNIVGTQSNFVVSNPATNQTTTTHISTSLVDYNSFIDLQTPILEIQYGNPIVLSSFFTPPAELQAKLVLSIQDDVRSVQVNETPLLTCGPGVPLTCGGSFISNIFNLGGIVAIVKAIDTSGQVIAVKSILLSLIEVNNSGSVQTSNTNFDRGIPPQIISNSTIPISTNPLYLSIGPNESKYVVYVSNTNQTKLSAVLKTRYNTEDQYSLTASKIAPPDEDAPLSIKAPKTLILEEIAHSTKRFLVNNEEVYIDSHNVALSNVSTALATNLVIIEVAPSINNIEGRTEGWLYVSENFYPRPISATATATTVTATVRLAQDSYGLIINGPESGVVPPNYVIKSTISNELGTATWSNLSLNRGDYYSIIESTNGNLNPFSNPVYIGRYT